MKIVTVIPLKKGAARDNLTYFTAQAIPSGSIVTIPLRNKKILGLVVSGEDVLDAKINIKGLNFDLKKVIEMKERSIFRKEYLESAIEISKYFAVGKNNAIASLIPSIFREKYDVIAKFPAPPKKENTPQNKKELKTEKLLFQAALEDRLTSYKTLIRASFAEKKSVFMVLPTEHDIKIFHQSLSRGIEHFAFVVHGGLDSKKITQTLKEVLALSHPVFVLGTAPFLSIPRGDLGIIILEHESSESYKMIGKPHLDLRIFVELLASKINAKLILGDALLSFETIGRHETDGFIPMHPLSFRVNFEGKIEIENPQKSQAAEPPGGGKAAPFKTLTEKSAKEIQNALAKKKNVFIFALRKGLATQTVCRDCSEVVSCDKCSAPLVLHFSEENKKRTFVCNRCEKEIRSDVKCASCGSWNLMPLGIGTDTVFNEAKKLFPKEKIFKLDKETAKNKKAAEKIAWEFEGKRGSTLVGTEMAFFYLKNKTSLSIIASFDSLWNIPNFKMSEKVIQLLISIMGNTTNKLIIQTRNENDPAILAIKTENLLSFVRDELEDRRNLGYPPFKRFIKITHLGDKGQTKRAREMLGEIFKEYSPEIFSGFIARRKGKYATNALIKVDPQKWSLPELSAGSSIDENLFTKLLFLSPHFEVFVDPENLL